MSCLGPNYNPIPQRQWYRFENNFANSCIPSDNQNGGVYQLYSADAIKGNVLQYKKNSSNLTKKQKYAKIVKGNWTNRTTTRATQSQNYTNPNTTSLKRVGYSKISLENPSTPIVNFTGIGEINDPNSVFSLYHTTSDPLTCPQPNNYNKKFVLLPNNNIEKKTNGSIKPPIIPIKTKQSGGVSNKLYTIPEASNNSDVPSNKNIVIPDGGTLVCNTKENICTGELYNVTEKLTCFPTSDSDVPGPIINLCYNDNNQTYYPRERKTYLAGGNKWPQGEKHIYPANNG